MSGFLECNRDIRQVSHLHTRIQCMYMQCACGLNLPNEQHLKDDLYSVFLTVTLDHTLLINTNIHIFSIEIFKIDELWLSTVT